MSKLLYHKIFKFPNRFYHRSYKELKFVPAIVKTSVDESKLPPPTKIDEETAEHLEAISLVGFQNEKSIQIVEDAIRFADQILEVNTTNVEPLFTVLENECLFLREDIANISTTADEILSNCKVSFENYIVAPIGNLEYISQSKSKKLKDDNNNILPNEEKVRQN